MKQLHPITPHSSQVISTLQSEGEDRPCDPALGSILSQCIVIPLPVIEPAMSQEFICIMDRIRLHIEATVKQAVLYGPLDFTLDDFRFTLDFTLDDFRDLFIVVPLGEGRLALYRLLPIWYSTVYISHLYWEKQWREFYEDTTLLTTKQEAVFFEQMRSPDLYVAARWRHLFIHRNMGLVGSQIKLYEHVLHHLENWKRKQQDLPTRWEMLQAAGLKGLEKAIDRFDPSRGWRFSTFAYKHIKGAITGLFKEREAAKPIEGFGYTDGMGRSIYGPDESQRIASDYLELWDAIHQAFDRLNDDRKVQILVRSRGLFNNNAETLSTIGKSFNPSVSPQRVRAIALRTMQELKQDSDLRLFYKRWF